MTLEQIRHEIRALVGPKAFERRPENGVAGLVVAAAGLALISALAVSAAPWYALALGAIVLSQMWMFLTMVAHEAMHGAVFQSRFGSELLCHIGFSVFGFGPETWRAWHLRAHHAKTNHPARDVDLVGLWGNQDAEKAARFVLGIGRLHAVLTLFVQFSLQAQLVTWSGREKFRRLKFSRWRARRQVLVLACLYGLAWQQLGLWLGLWLLALPALLANFTVMSYISTQHLLRPLSEINDPLANTISVSSHWLADRLHLCFSYHREHHLFPSMSHRSGPQVRRSLAQLGLQPEPPLSHWRAFKLVLATPRLYDGSHVLRQSARQTFELGPLWSQVARGERALIERVEACSPERLRALVERESRRAGSRDGQGGAAHLVEAGPVGDHSA